MEDGSTMVKMPKPANLRGKHQHCFYEMGSLAGPRTNARLWCWAAGSWLSELAKGVKYQKEVGSSDYLSIASSRNATMKVMEGRIQCVWLNWVEFITGPEINALGSQVATVSRAKESDLV